MIAMPFIICCFVIALLVFDSPDITKILVLLLAAVFALIGIVQLSGRDAWFTTDYNTMTEAGKAQYNPKSLQGAPA